MNFKSSNQSVEVKIEKSFVILRLLAKLASISTLRHNG